MTCIPSTRAQTSDVLDLPIVDLEVCREPSLQVHHRAGHGRELALQVQVTTPGREKVKRELRRVSFQVDKMAKANAIEIAVNNPLGSNKTQLPLGV